MSDDSGVTCQRVCVLPITMAHAAIGRIGRPAFPAPSNGRGREFHGKPRAGCVARTRNCARSTPLPPRATRVAGRGQGSTIAGCCLKIGHLVGWAKARLRRAHHRIAKQRWWARFALPTLRAPKAVIAREIGRCSIPETSMIESKGRGVLDPPPARGMTIAKRSRFRRC
jgi:hypothetical protein